MNNLELNIPMLIFIAGAALFLLAPVTPFSSFNANDLHKTALLLQSIGVTACFLVFCRSEAGS